MAVYVKSGLALPPQCHPDGRGMKKGGDEKVIPEMEGTDREAPSHRLQKPILLPSPSYLERTRSRDHVGNFFTLSNIEQDEIGVCSGPVDRVRNKMR